MKNKKGFVGLIALMITVLVMVAGFLLWLKYSKKAFEDVTGTQVDEKGDIIPNPEIKSPQGEVNAVRDMMDNIMDNKNKEIEDELNK